MNNVGAWRSLVARLPWAQEVRGSNPRAPTNQFTNLATGLFRPGPVRLPFWCTSSEDLASFPLARAAGSEVEIASRAVLLAASRIWL